MSPEEKQALEPRYIGDGVYASFDGYQIWLRIGGSASEDIRIALEPGVFQSLVAYAKGINQACGQDYF